MQNALAWLRKYIYTVLWVMQANTLVLCPLRSDVARVYCVLIVMLKHLQYIWPGDRGEEEGHQCLQSHHAVSTPACFSFSQIRHRVWAQQTFLKLLFLPYTLTITTSFLSSSMSLSFFPFFFPPCSDVAVGSYLSLPACKGRYSIIRNILQSNFTAVDMNYTPKTARQTKLLQFIKTVYLNFSKVFNTVSYSILLEKQAACSLDRCTTCWVKEKKLEGWTKKVGVNSVTSSWHQLGSPVLRQILFNIFISDLDK